MQQAHKAKVLGLTLFQLSKLDGAKELISHYCDDPDVMIVQAIKICKCLPKSPIMAVPDAKAKVV